MPGSGFGLRGGRRKGAAAAAYAFAEFLALFGGHLRPALHHAMAPVPAPAMTSAEAAEQDLAQHQNAQGLPVGDFMPAKYRRHKPVPQPHDYKTEQAYSQDYEWQDCQYFQRPIFFHFYLVHRFFFSSISFLAREVPHLRDSSFLSSIGRLTQRD